MELALIKLDKEGRCIIVVNRIRLVLLTFVHINETEYCNNSQGPCPISKIEAFKNKFTEIRVSPKSMNSVFKDNNEVAKYLNIIEIPHVRKILCLTREYSAQRVSVIFSISL